MGGGFKYFSFSPLLLEIIYFDEHIFQMGWFNHQPETMPPVIKGWTSSALRPLVLDLQVTAVSGGWGEVERNVAPVGAFMFVVNLCSLPVANRAPGSYIYLNLFIYTQFLSNQGFLQSVPLPVVSRVMTPLLVGVIITPLAHLWGHL